MCIGPPAAGSGSGSRLALPLPGLRDSSALIEGPGAGSFTGEFGAVWNSSSSSEILLLRDLERLGFTVPVTGVSSSLSKDEDKYPLFKRYSSSSSNLNRYLRRSSLSSSEILVRQLAVNRSVPDLVNREVDRRLGSWPALTGKTGREDTHSSKLLII
jgi:hypothetical protein